MAVNGTAQAATLYPCGIPAAKTSPQESLSETAAPDPWIIEESKPQLSMREMLAQMGVKGFCNQMPKVSEYEVEAEAKKESEALQRQQMNYKTHLSQMSVDEINELVKDPIIRKELTPQIIFNEKFDIVTDNLGEVLAVKISQEYLDSGGT
jgi:hypothetical protein